MFDPPPGVTVVRGDVLDAVALAAALDGCAAVASCLGLRRAGHSPWAPLRSPADLTASAMRVLVPLMETRTIRRLAVISAGGVGDSRRQLSWPVQKLVAAGNIGVAYRDLAAMEDVLSASSLDWLAVRPVTLVNGAPTGRGVAVDRYGLLSTVRRADVAQWLLAAVESSPPFSQRAVLLGTATRN